MDPTIITVRGVRKCALREACQRGLVEIVKMLLMKCRFTESAFDNAVMTAMDCGQQEICDILECNRPVTSPEVRAKIKQTFIVSLKTAMLYRNLAGIEHCWEKICRDTLTDNELHQILVDAYDAGDIVMFRRCLELKPNVLPETLCRAALCGPIVELSYLSSRRQAEIEDGQKEILVLVREDPRYGRWLGAADDALVARMKTEHAEALRRITEREQAAERERQTREKRLAIGNGLSNGEKIIPPSDREHQPNWVVSTRHTPEENQRDIARLLAARDAQPILVAQGAPPLPPEAPRQPGPPEQPLADTEIMSIEALVGVALLHPL